MSFPRLGAGEMGDRCVVGKNPVRDKVVRAFDFDVVDLFETGKFDGNNRIPQQSIGLLKTRLGVSQAGGQESRQAGEEMVDFIRNRLKMKNGPSLIEKYIWRRPDICHGKACFKGTRIMVYLALEMLEAGASYDEIREGYPEITPQHIKAALEYAARVLEQAHVVITPGVGFGPAGEDYVRMSLTVPTERMQEAVNRIANVL